MQRTRDIFITIQYLCQCISPRGLFVLKQFLQHNQIIFVKVLFAQRVNDERFEDNLFVPGDSRACGALVL